MAKIQMLATSEAAQIKGCTRKAIVDAIKRGDIDGDQTGRYFVVRANKRFEAWQPNPRRQQIGRESQKKPKKATRKRK